MLDNKDIELLSKALSFFKNLSVSQQDYLLDNATLTHYSKGQVLHYGANECLGVLIIKKGMLRTYIISEEGREVTLFRPQRGDVCILSASCVLKAIDFDVCIEAENNCDIIQISALAYSLLSSENVHVELFSYKLATEKFSDVMWTMQQILFTSFDNRLASFLLEEAVRDGCLDVIMTHEEIAKHLGSAREVVTRMLKYFSKEGYITVSRGVIHINDYKKLSDIIK